MKMESRREKVSDKTLGGGIGEAHMFNNLSFGMVRCAMIVLLCMTLGWVVLPAAGSVAESPFGDELPDEIAGRFKGDHSAMHLQRSPVFSRNDDFRSAIGHLRYDITAFAQTGAAIGMPLLRR